MPIHAGKDSRGKYMRWGHHGKKYYYTSAAGRSMAKKKAQKQAVAAYSHGYVENKKKTKKTKKPNPWGMGYAALHTDHEFRRNRGLCLANKKRKRTKKGRETEKSPYRRGSEMTWAY